MFFDKRIKKFVKEMSGVAGRYGDFEHLGKAGFAVGNVIAEAVLQTADFLCLAVKHTSRIRQFQRAAAADKKLGAIVFLNVFQLIAERRLCNQELVCRSQNTSAFYDSDKIFVRI